MCINKGRCNSDAKYEVYWTIWDCWENRTTCLQIGTKTRAFSDSWSISCKHVKKISSNPTHVLKDQEVEISENLNYIEEPFKIIGYKIKKLRNRDIPLVKAL